MNADNLERAFIASRPVIAGTRPDQWASPTPCESWDVRALVNHMVGGTYVFADAVNTGRHPEREETDHTAGDVLAAYDEGAARTLAAFRAPGVDEKMIEMPFGSVPGSVLITIFTTDAFAHAWDLARATGQDSNLDAELAREILAGARTYLLPQFRGPDGQAPFGPEQSAPDAASPADVLAAFLGRSV